jgi:phospholipid/cholesterol/gamma-HCH transport system substrate-binding protein
MKNTLETRLGVFFALAVFAGIVIVEMIGGFDFFHGGYRITALFNTVQELKVGDGVKMAGKEIGKVEKIDFADSKVEVTMKIVNKKATIKTDSKASIKFMGLLGQNYVAIDFGTPKGLKVQDGTQISSIEQPDISGLMTKLDGLAGSIESLTKSFSSESLSTFLGPITDFLKDNREKLSGIISNVQTISGNIAEGKGTVGKLINEDTVYQAALTTVTNVDITLDDAREAMSQAKLVITKVNQGQGTLGKLLTDNTLYTETTGAMTNLHQIFEKINRGQGSIGKLVNDESLIKNVKVTLQKLDKATEGLEDQGPLSVIGLVVGNLF